MGREEKIEKNKQSILQILSERTDLCNSIQLAELLKDIDVDLSERSVRIYLNQLDQEGLTESFGKRGRKITQQGLEELKALQLQDRVGYMSTKIDNMTYKMTFDLSLRRGTVVINVAILKKELLISRLDQICQVFSKGYAMGTLVSLLYPGDKLNEITIPEGTIGFCTVCSVTLNGVLLKHGIPTRSIFSGLLDLENGKGKRFSERINYDGTSIDPLQLFIRGRMTDYVGAIKNGNGRIGAGFREIPEDSYSLAGSLAEKLGTIGLGAFLKIGRPSQDLFNIPVHQGSCGVIVIGGLNPVAILEETGGEVLHYAIAGLMEYNQLFSYKELEKRLK